MKNIIETLKTIHTTYKFLQSMLLLVITVVVFGLNFLTEDL
jgi:hypothetical protein